MTTYTAFDTLDIRPFTDARLPILDGEVVPVHTIDADPAFYADIEADPWFYAEVRDERGEWAEVARFKWWNDFLRFKHDNAGRNVIRQRQRGDIQ